MLPVLAGAGACRSGSDFYVPAPRKEALQQIRSLVKSHDFQNAVLLTKMVSKGHAVWLTGGTPAEVKKQVKKVMRLAKAQRALPVFVAYNVPYRDCAQYSAGGALSTAEYKAWIDGVAAGIGTGAAKVIVEPDGLGLIPYYDPYGSADGSNGLEWCQPTVDGEPAPEADPAHRFEQLNYAVDTLGAKAKVGIYLDATHSGWLGVGDAAHRLSQAGIEDADGFFLNVSNYQYTANLTHYGTWVSKCLAGGSTFNGSTNYNGCPNQYWNGGPDGTMIADLLGAWNGVSLNNYGEWSDTSTDAALNTSGLTARYAGVTATKHFVIDTSRNGQGPWNGTLDWCNAPGRGVGIAPTANTGNELLDAYLWGKVPGESDGTCDARWVDGGDPAWGGIQDPPAGSWFPEAALALAQNANPPLTW